MPLGRIRHLPVLDDDEKLLVGMVSQRDLFRGALARVLGYGEHASRKVLDSLFVKEVMSTDVITTTPDTPLVEVARVMMERKSAFLSLRTGGSSASSRRLTSWRWWRARASEAPFCIPFPTWRGSYRAPRHLLYACSFALWGRRISSL